jgi:hypothetical protein
MKKLKLTLVSKEFYIREIEVEDDVFESLTKQPEAEVWRWAQQWITAPDQDERVAEWIFSDADDDRVCFVDQEDGEPLYEN